LPFKTALEIPELAGKYTRDLDWQGKVVQSCVHCHQIGDAMRSFYRDQKKPIPSEWIYAWPEPEVVGLTFAPESAATVQAVSPNSPSEKAGFQLGDELIAVADQPLLSSADFSWALHRAPEGGSLAITVKRGATQKSLSLALSSGWRSKANIARRVGTWPLRAMATGGLLLEDLSDEERLNRKFKASQMALFVKHAGEYGQHAAAKKAGFQKADVLIELDGNSSRISESELIGRLLGKQPGEKVKATVLRGEQRLELLLPIQ
jgi:predicted metalloprotease with PDZ domain